LKYRTDSPEPLLTITAILKEPFEEQLNEPDSREILMSLEKLLPLAGSPKTKELIEKAIDEYNTFVNSIGFDSLLRELILEDTTGLQETGVWLGGKKEVTEQVVTEKDVDEKEKIPAPTKKKTGKEDEKTMRISEKNIDSFLAYVGELVVVQEMFKYLQRNIMSSGLEKSIQSNFKRILENFDVLADQLQSSILSIRMVPINTVLQKVPRIVNDVAGKSGKKIKVTITGEKLKIDKSYVELLDAPVVHMIRNSVDHGIESPEERKQKGKDETGHVQLIAEETDEVLVLTIVDDGRGINFDAIKNKAVELGIIKPDESLKQENLVDLLFQSGVSTAEKVTDISGRGVGMDVVKSNIDSAGGLISIETTPGQGTTSRITLPKNITTQIINGFIVGISNETYVLPLNKINESFVPKKSEISTVTGKGEVLNRRGQILPLIRLSNIIGGNVAKDGDDDKEEVFIAIEINNKLYALVVDQIVGIHKVVVKSVTGLPTQENIFSGAALMGDGTVSMIIDIDKLSTADD